MTFINLSYKMLTPTEQIKRVTKDVEAVAGHETAIESVNIAVRFFAMCVQIAKLYWMGAVTIFAKNCV